jgi:hypothetical protein
MIGSAARYGGRAAGIGSALLLGLLLCLRPAAADAADPPVAAERVAVLHSAAANDVGRLDALIATLRAAVDAGRHGSALVIEGDADPAPALQRAADAAAQAVDLALAAEQADSSFEATRSAVQPSTAPLSAGPSSADLAGVEGQLRGAAVAAGPFVQRRRAAADTLEALASVLAALEADDAKRALAALDRADRARATVAQWPDPPTVLPYWLDTTGAMLSAARSIADATIAHDAAAAERSGRAYRRASRDARQADTALALSISEAGSSLAAVPLRRLAEALRLATQRRAAVASVLH